MGYPQYQPNGLKRSPFFKDFKARIQTLACLLHSSSIVLLPALFFWLLTKPSLWPLLLIYCIWSYLLGGASQSHLLRSQWLFKEFINYFPISVHRTVKLPPSFNDDEQRAGPRYLFTYHPHGVIAFGITGIMCYDGPQNDPTWTTNNLTSSNQFNNLFPNIKPHLLTIKTQFYIPFYRDYIKGLGIGLVTKSGIRSLLSKWHSPVIVVGGAHESLLAKPGKNSLILNKRKGFIKMALESTSGIDKDNQLNEDQINSFINNGEWDSQMGDIAIVPIYGFGENNIHQVVNTAINNENNSKLLNSLLKFQLLLKKYSGFTLPLVNSRGIFNYDFGLLPYRRPINLVYGKPIYILRKFGNKPGDKAHEDEINYYHSLYKDQLLNLWHENKSFTTQWDEELNFVE